MDFIREKIKEKPMSKKKIFLKLGIAALCGLIFSIVVLVMMAIFIPVLRKSIEVEAKNTESLSEEITDTQSTEELESTEEMDCTETDMVIPPDLNLSISDYQTLQDELYEIGNRVNQSIVTVMTLSGENADWSQHPFEAEAQSSGLMVSEDTNYIYILTEKKVISDTEHIRVSFVDGTSADATLLKYDGNTKLSILTVEKRQLTVKTKERISTAVIGSSYEMTNGSIVIALGSPLGTNYSILTGNITSVQNEIATQDKNYSVFTTDIVAGENASGVLVNTKGEVIGIVMQSLSSSQEVNTLTAVEIDELAGMIEFLCNGKDVPYMGLYVSTVTKTISKEYDIPIGVYIKEVVSDSPAMKAGLQSGDVIVEMNEEAISTDMAYSNALHLLIPGTTCEIRVKRQNGDKYYEVTCMVEIGILE